MSPGKPVSMLNCTFCLEIVSYLIQSLDLVMPLPVILKNFSLYIFSMCKYQSIKWVLDLLSDKMKRGVDIRRAGQCAAIEDQKKKWYHYIKGLFLQYVGILVRNWNRHLWYDTRKESIDTSIFWGLEKQQWKYMEDLRNFSPNNGKEKHIEVESLVT